MEYILIAKVLKPFGVKGELKLELYSDFAQERFKQDTTVYLKIDEAYQPFSVLTYRKYKEYALVSFKGYAALNDVEAFHGLFIYKAADDIKALEDAYYFHDLVGLNVYDEKLKYLGKCLQVEEGVKYNFLRLEKEDATTALIPFIPTFIKEVSLKDKRIIVKTIEGLI